MSKKLRHWAKGNQEMREGSAMVLTWLQAVCTKDPAHPAYSSLDTITWPVPHNAETAQWTVAHLHATIPRPKQRTATTPPEPAHDSPTVPTNAAHPQTAALCERIMALSDTIIMA
jgi:hypothetical protein